MNVGKLMLCAALIAVACNGKLSVNGDGGDGGVAGVAGNPGASGAGSGGEWHGPIAGEGPREFPAGAAGVPEIEGGSGGRDFGTGGSPAGATAGWVSTAGGPVVVPPRPGEIGQDCVPGALVTEADGSLAKTVIKTLDRCNEGLACDAEGKCVPAPDCPSSGLCVMRRAALGGSGGVGGAPGSNPTAASGASGAPSSSGGVPGSEPTYYTTEKKGVVALTADESRVYWLEYGRRDALGNYQHDGTLMSYSISDGTTAVVLSELAGPVDLKLTTSHAYVYVDGGALIGTPTQAKLLRVPLTGGSAELVQDGARPTSFAAAGSRAFWSSNSKVYSMLSDSNAVPTLFLTGAATRLTCDATDLYYSGSDGLMRAPLTSATATAVGIDPSEFALHDDGIFTLESIDEGGLLSRAPKSGGAFQRVRALGAGTPRELRAVGDRYFLAVVAAQSGSAYNTRKRHVLTAGFVGSDPPIRLLERNDRRTPVDQLWVGTRDALYWSEGQAIYKQPLPAP